MKSQSRQSRLRPILCFAFSLQPFKGVFRRQNNPQKTRQNTAKHTKTRLNTVKHASAVMEKSPGSEISPIRPMGPLRPFLRKRESGGPGKACFGGRTTLKKHAKTRQNTAKHTKTR